MSPADGRPTGRLLAGIPACVRRYPRLCSPIPALVLRKAFATTLQNNRAAFAAF